MDRRSFFKQGFLDTAGKVLDETAEQARARATHWIRPPYALDELDFLLRCTRCFDCTKACPEQLIFPLPPRLGAQVAATPALNLIHQACLMCDGWPCVSACTTGALQLPAPVDETPPPPPKIAAVNVDTRHCLPYLGPECGACATSCPVPGALVFTQDKPHINHAVCTGCACCRSACIADPKALVVRSIYHTGVPPTPDHDQ